MNKANLFLFSGIVALTILTGCGTNSAPLRVGMDLRYPPFESITDQGEAEGISVDIANAFGDFLSRPTEILNTNFGTLIPSIEIGEIDIVIASMSITEARAQVVDFSNPYLFFKIITLVNQNFATANGLTIDSTTEEILDIPSTRYAGIASQVSATIPQSFGKTVTEFVDLGSAISSVSDGTSDVLLMSASPVINGFKNNRSTTMVVWDPWVSSPIGMAVQKGNQELLDLANDFIATFDDEGGLYDVLRDKWDETVEEQLERYGMDFYILP
jgi:polar amino acid transport system substrate-binding protein